MQGLDCMSLLLLLFSPCCVSAICEAQDGRRMPALLTCKPMHAQRNSTAEVNDIMHVHMEGSLSKDKWHLGKAG